MWTGILALLGTVAQFLCKWGMSWLERNDEKRKARAEIKKNEINTAKTQRELILAINKYNRI